MAKAKGAGDESKPRRKASIKRANEVVVNESIDSVVSAAEELTEAPLLIDPPRMGLPTKARPFLVSYFPSIEQAHAEHQAREAELEFQEGRAARALLSVINQWSREMKATNQRASFSIALRTKMGFIIAPLQYVILVDVEEKLPDQSLQQRNLFKFPSQVQDVPVKVRQLRISSCVGNLDRIESMAGSGLDFGDSLTELKGGDGIQSTGKPNTFGTLGICIPHVGGLTNNHVAGDAGSISPAGQIAQVIGSVGLHRLNQLVDATIVDSNARIPFQEGTRGDFYPPSNFRFLDNVDLNALLQFRLKPVFKVGFVSKRTEGGISIRCKPSTAVPDVSSTFEFENLIEVYNTTTRFLSKGDSGSVLVCPSIGLDGVSYPLVIGLNFAATDDGRTAYAIPFGAVKKQLNLQIPADKMVHM